MLMEGHSELAAVSWEVLNSTQKLIHGQCSHPPHTSPPPSSNHKIC